MALLSSAAALASSSAPAGSLHQPNGTPGCYTEDGVGGCRDLIGGIGATSIAISPDGRFAYVDGYGGNSTTEVPVLAALKRNPKTGTLTQLPGKSGCYSRDGSSEDGSSNCTKARDLDSGDATSLVISSDGRFLYVASQYDKGTTEVGGIAVFARNLKTGALRQLKGKAGCLTAVAYNGCSVAREVTEVANLHFSPDHKFLYASDYDAEPYSGFAVFSVSAKTGALHQLKGSNGCSTDNGRTRDSGATKVCGADRNLDNPWDIATPDNRFAYITASYSKHPLVEALKRNSQGGLVPLTGPGSCVSDSGLSATGKCVQGRGLFNPERIVLSNNGRFLYIGSFSYPSPTAVLNRNPTTGKLSERSGTAACISINGSTGDGSTCRVGTFLTGTYAGAMSSDGRTLYYSEYANAARGGVTIFRVSPTTGAFSQLPGTFGCVTTDGASEKGPGTCGVGRALLGAYQVAVSGLDVYVASYYDNGVALFYAHR